MNKEGKFVFDCKDSKLKFGVMCDGYSLQLWQAECIKLLTQNNIELSLLIINDNPAEKISFLRKIINYQYRYIIFNLYNRFILKPKSKTIVDISEDAEGVASIKCKTSGKGFSQYFEEKDVQKIREANLDFILRFGFNIIRGDILNSAKYGVWSFHHDDEQKYRGSGSMMKEILYNDSVNGAILQKLNNRLDGGIILKKGYRQTVMHSLSGNIDHQFFNTSKWPLQVCNDIINGVAHYFNDEASTSKAPLKKIEGNLYIIVLIFKIWYNKMKFHFKELFLTESWQIGIVNSSAKQIIENQISPSINWLKAPRRSRYFADPFGFKINDSQILLFFEDYNYRTRKGVISSCVFDPNNKSFSEVKKVLEQPYHLAYPYIFRYEDEWFLMPEASESNKVDVYKILEDGSLSLVKTLLEIDAVDPSLFFYEGLWWLLFTRKLNANEELHAYYAKEIFGEYKPHKNNPIKTDVRSSRPAGVPFVLNEDIIRPAQSSAKYYGSMVAFNKILKLTTTGFNEELVQFVKPFKKTSFNKGIHTLCQAEDYTIIDQKKHVFIMQSFLYQFKSKIRNLFK